ncbi:hypothetical protein sos41_12240 [Alphaproteobacteria bacterium SO-S41]|nr:hypothetical protein sos41_12240 [Alphaproteobacteria bacterium SO-S41]
MPARDSQSFRPARHPLAARLVILLTVVGIIGLIGASAYFADRIGLKGGQSWIILVPVAVASVVIGFCGAFLAERLNNAAPRRVSASAWRAGMMAKQRAFEAHPDPRLRRYAVFFERGIDLADSEIARREQRLREIERDPAKAKYAERIFKGETITDAAIAYWEDPWARVTCEHLTEIEGDLRRADPGMRPGGGKTVFTALDFDLPELTRRYRPADSVAMQNGHWDDRAPSSDPMLRCRACNAAIIGGFGASFPMAPTG